MQKLKIKDKEYELKLTIESWKKLKAFHGITPSNSEKKLGEDTATTLSAFVYFSLSPEVRESVSIEEVDLCIDFKVTEVINEVILDSMPKVINKKSSEGGDSRGKK